MAGLTPSREELTDNQDSELWKSLENKDLYKVLGVPSDASARDIDRAYKRRVLDVHPDKHKDALSTERFKELTNAKELLLDIGKRWWYDTRRDKEAEVVARAVEGAKLRAKAKAQEDGCNQQLAKDEEKHRQQFKVDKEQLAKFVEQAMAPACVAALNGDDPVGAAGAKLNASAAEFVPSAAVEIATPGAAAASATPAVDRVVEVYSMSAQKWCLGLIIGVCPLPGSRAALTVRYQVTEAQWNEKLLYDSDLNLRSRRCEDGAADGAADLWNQWKERQSGEKSDMRAEAPVFLPASQFPPPSPMQPMGPAGPMGPIGLGPHGPRPNGPMGPAMFMAPARQIKVTVRPGCVGGQHINIMTPSGRSLVVQIPPGLQPGQTFLCTEPPGVVAPGYPRGQGPVGEPGPHPGYHPGQRAMGGQPMQAMAPTPFAGPPHAEPARQRPERESGCVIS